MQTEESQMFTQYRSTAHERELSDSVSEGESGASVLPDKSESDSIASNLEASLCIYTEHHLFSWTQGVLQNLIRHDVLTCVLRKGDTEVFDVDSFSTCASEPEPFSLLYRQDAGLSDSLVKNWQVQHYQPLILDIGDHAELTESLLRRELKRIGASKLMAHGTYDASGRMKSFFVFACQPEDAGHRQLRLIEMLVPFLHAAWVRTKINLSGSRSESAAAGGGRDILTVREQEVLRWVYLGKSNIEIGLILGISPLTVKNHVQEILRRLNVQNRAQAVGKAFKLHILSC